MTGDPHRGGGSSIDRDALRALLRTMARSDHLAILDRAFDRLSDEDVHWVTARRVYPARIERGDRAPSGLLESVDAFHAASVAGKWYQSALRDWSQGTPSIPRTEEWSADFEWLLDRCMTLAREDAALARRSEVVPAMRLLFDLIRRIDVGQEIIAFADDDGTDSFSIDWAEAFPCFARSLAAAAEPRAFAEEVATLLRARHPTEREALFSGVRSSVPASHGDALGERWRAERR